MFRSRAAPDDVQHAETTSFDEDTIKSDIGTFSFFGFNLFEVDDTLQHDVDDESVKEEAPIKSEISEVKEPCDVTVDSKGTPRRAFWQSSRDSGDDSKDRSVMTKLKGNLSRTLGSIKRADLNLAERIRSTSQRTGKLFDRVHFKEVDHQSESRDDLERSRATTYVESFDSVSRDAYDEGRSTDKKCFPSWSLKKNRATAGFIEPMNTINETELSRPVEKAHKPEKNTEQHSYVPHNHHDHHHHHHRSSTRAAGKPRHSSRKYEHQHQREYVSSRRAPSKPQLRTTGTYVKPSNYDDNIWDDQSTSSGWFSLESLDAR